MQPPESTVYDAVTESQAPGGDGKKKKKKKDKDPNKKDKKEKKLKVAALYDDGDADLGASAEGLEG